MVAEPQSIYIMSPYTILRCMSVESTRKGLRWMKFSFGIVNGKSFQEESEL